MPPHRLVVLPAYVAKNMELRCFPTRIKYPHQANPGSSSAASENGPALAVIRTPWRAWPRAGSPVLSSRVHRILLGRLTQTEAEDALRAASRRHPALSLAVQRSDDAVPADDGPVYVLAIDEEDFERYRDIVDEIVSRVRPTRLRMQDLEDELANLLAQVLDSPTPWTVGAKPIARIASLFEWRIVPYLLPFGDFVDGFNPTTVKALPPSNERGIALSGTSFLFSGSKAPFEAEIAVRNDKLSHLELRFGDASFAAVDQGIIPSDAPDVAERIVSGYRTLVRKNVAVRSENADERWAFVIARQ